MLTLYHSPRSRATRILQLAREMGIEDDLTLTEVTVCRSDGTGARDPANPHPEGKVPLLVHDGAVIRESNAIMLYLTDLYPETPLGRPVGHPSRGAYLSWLAWYGNVFEPVFLLDFAGLSHPALGASLRDLDTAVSRLTETLSQRDYLVDDNFSAADILLASTYGWLPDAVPDVPVIRDWVARCLERPAMQEVSRAQMAP